MTGMCEACPFDFGTEATEIAQNWGCLPTPGEIITMRIAHGRTWECHSRSGCACVGAIQELHERGLPHKIINHVLVNERTHELPEICKP